MCKQTIDVYGDHATCCTKKGDLIVRHNGIRNLMNKLATEGMLSPVMEKKGILGPTSGRRPGDVTIERWSQSKGLAIDVAVTSPFAKGAVLLASPCEEYANRKKHGKYDAGFKGVDYLFSPVVFETLGAVNEEGARVLSQLARFAALRSGKEFSSFCGRVWARFSCNLQRSVSQSILNRMDGCPLEDDDLSPAVPRPESGVPRLSSAPPQVFSGFSTGSLVSGGVPPQIPPFPLSGPVGREKEGKQVCFTSTLSCTAPTFVPSLFSPHTPSPANTLCCTSPTQTLNTYTPRPSSVPLLHPGVHTMG
jgi:hypothetical protein